MSNAAEIRTLASRLPESDLAKLAADLLDSLQEILTEDDDGLAEARRRSEERAHDAEEYRMDLRLREAVENYANGDRGAPAKVVMNELRERAQKRRSVG